MVHEGHTSQEAVLSVRSDSHHLAIDGHGSGEANDWRVASGVIREDSHHYYVKLAEELEPLRRSCFCYIHNKMI